MPRTTLTLDPDVSELLEEEMHRRRVSFKEAVNDALRRALSPGGGQRERRPYRVRTFKSRLRPGYDPSGFNRLADELEDAAVVERARKAGR